MEKTLRLFMESSLYDACLQMLHHLQVRVNEVTREPVPFVDLYQGTYSSTLPKALQEALGKVEATYYIGNIDEATLAGSGLGKSVDEVRIDTEAGKYEGMMVFAIDVANGENLSRQESTNLTRGFNRIASAQPVILFIRQGKYLSLATCERMTYSQEWRNGNSEKLGKVSILRNINCEHPHRGHLDILNALGDKAYPTFEALYKHWMEVFSNELLTKKFYNELSDWYAWAVQVARFPNDITTDKDDEKFNHEACIRLITRLIFVWFLKQKHLIPDEFFDEDYIREHFIENFNPHDRKNIYYDTEKSKYYRLILQNLFFAMLNRPIVAEGKDVPNNRRFRSKLNGGMNWEYNVNNLMRYEGDFMPGGAEEFLRLANCSVPFLNGGLFECLDDKPNKIYYDGFSESKSSLAQLYLPDYLFFGDEVGRSIDLSQWYGDKKKKNVSAQGIIDILRHYCFTVEENTPYDQEVSLDPELLGKAFENLLAAYNPETQTSARKQTGSFYTPREIVQYMVNESLVAHLKRVCGDKDEALYRQLLSYSAEDVAVTDEQSSDIMDALYHCRVLDPACGSGAFPMGILQQMVHVLKRIDPTNEKWKDFMINRAIEQSKKAFMVDIETERKDRLADIENAFNRSVNDPDYARKLYLIEHCIYGVDIQPIATQISKLRFFISLVVDQRPTADAAHNFGIRPLPNLEAKFVSANTLIPVEYDSSLVDSAPAVVKYKEELKELNHKIFLARRNMDKQNLKKQIKETRQDLATAIEDTGFVSHGAAQQLASWDMFDQNTSSPFFDPEWMFGVKGGFDIVIANPPYVTYKGKQRVVISDEELQTLLSVYVNSAEYKINSYALFVELGIGMLNRNGIMSFIIPSTILQNEYLKKIRKYLLTKNYIQQILSFGNKVFGAVTDSIILQCSRYSVTKTLFKRKENLNFNHFEDVNEFNQKDWDDGNSYVINVKSSEKSNEIFAKMEKCPFVLGDLYKVYVGIVANGIKKFLANEKLDEGYVKYLQGKHIAPYELKPVSLFLNFQKDLLHSNTDESVYNMPEKILVRKTGNVLMAALDDKQYYTDQSLYNLYVKKGCCYNNKVLLIILNSKLMNYYYNTKFITNADVFPYIKGIHLKAFPLPNVSIEVAAKIEKEVLLLQRALVDENKDVTTKMVQKMNILVYHLYGLTYDEVLIVDPNTPISREEYEAYKGE